MDELLQSLPPVIYLPITFVLILLGLFAKAGKFPQSLNAIIKRVVGDGQVSEESIDKAVERILSGGNPPSPLVDWIGDVVGKFFASAPNWSKLTYDQKVSLIASVFSNLPKRKAKKAVPKIPDAILEDKRARWTFFKKMIGGNHVPIDK